MEHTTRIPPRRTGRLRAARTWPLFAAASVCALAAPSFAQEAATPEAKTIVEKMQAASSPDQPILYRMKLHVSMGKSEGWDWEVVEARKKLGDGIHHLYVVLEPQDAKGTAYLIVEREQGADQLWIYLPHLGRVRQLSEVNRYEHFLNSDFSLSEFGLGAPNPKYRLLGTAKLDGVECYQIEETSDETWHYSRIVDWVAKDTYQRLRRDFYDVADRLWKVEHFEEITTVQGQRMPLRIRMENRQRQATSVIDVVAVKLGASIPDALLQSDQLATAPKSPVWSSVEAGDEP